MFAIPISPASGTINLNLSSPNNASLGTPATAVLSVTNYTAPTVQFASSTFNANQSDGAAVITVTLSNPYVLPVTVNFATSDGTDKAGLDYVPNSGTLIFSPGDTSQTFQVRIVPNPNSPVSGTVNLALSVPTVATLGSPATATLTIVNDYATQPNVHFPSGNFAAYQNGNFATITVVLSAPYNHPVSVGYGTANGTATAPLDYLPATGTLVFAPGQVNQSFQVIISPTSTPNRTINLTLSSPVNATLGNPSSAVLTILLGSPPPNPLVAFASSNFVVEDSEPDATIVVTLSAPSAQTITVNYATADGTGKATVNYTATNGTLTFPPNTLTQSFQVPIIFDSTPWTSKTVNLTLNTPVNATLGPQGTAVLTIIKCVPCPGYLP
jgi:hypothetical protein